jgi:hypothetical protein
MSSRPLFLSFCQHSANIVSADRLRLVVWRALGFQAGVEGERRSLLNARQHVGIRI